VPLTVRHDAVQHLRVTFGVDWPVCFASVLDQGRLWERLARRARVPLTYSQGFSPHPRLSLGMALPVGYASDCETVDLYLAERLEVSDVRETLERQAPPGIRIRDVADVPLAAPAPQATMREAEYLVPIAGSVPCTALRSALAALLRRTSIPRTRVRKGAAKAYDLRPLIIDATCEPAPDGGTWLRLRLVCGAGGAGRVEEVVDELGLTAHAGMVRRVRLIWGPDARAGEETER